MAVAWSTMFVVGAELFVFSPLLPLLAADYHIRVGKAGLIVTIFSLAYMLSAPLFGHIADRFGRRRVLISSLVLFAAANFVTASAPDLPALLAARLLAGVAAAGISPSTYALVCNAAPPERRTTWLALAVSGLLTALPLGASTGAIIGAACGWPVIFAGLAGLSLGLAWLSRRVWPDERDARPRASAAAPDGTAAAALVCRLAPTVVWSTSLYGVYTYLGAGLFAIGFSAEQTARAIFCYGCGAIAGVFIGGRAADRFGVKLSTGVSFAGLCACLLLLRLALDTGTLIELAIGVTAAVAQLFFPAQQASLAADFPRQRCAALAWNNSALFFGISLGSILGGEAIAVSNFDMDVTMSAAVALIGWCINRIVVSARAPQDHPCQ